MNKKTVRDGFEYYIEIEPQGGEEYEYHMLMENEIDNILPLNIMTVNEKRQLIYAASGYRTIENSFEKMPVTAEQIFHIMNSVLNGIDNVKKYLLNPNSLLLSPDSVFFDQEYRKTGLLYVPGHSEDIIVQLRTMMEFLLDRIDQSDTGSVVLSWKIYVLLKEEHVSLKEIRRVIENSREKKEMVEKKEKNNHKSGAAEKSRIKTGVELGGLSEKAEFIKNNRLWSICFIAVSVCCLVAGIVVVLILYSIYTEGIFVWKRNQLLLSTGLLILNFAAVSMLWKKGKVLQTIQEIRKKITIRKNE